MLLPPKSSAVLPSKPTAADQACAKNIAWAEDESSANYSTCDSSYNSSQGSSSSSRRKIRHLSRTGRTSGKQDPLLGVCHDDTAVSGGSPIAGPITNTKRSVRFANDQYQATISRRDMTVVEVSAYWWSEKDHVAIRNQARRAILQAQHQNPCLLEKCIDRSYRSVRRFANQSAKAGNVNEFNQTIADPSKLCQALEEWYLVAGDKIGLEEYLMVSKRRSQLAKHARSRVVQEAANNSTGSAESLANTCQKYSHAGRLFARCHGYALAVAVREPIPLDGETIGIQ